MAIIKLFDVMNILYLHYNFKNITIYLYHIHTSLNPSKIKLQILKPNNNNNNKIFNIEIQNLKI